jgi:hypothetical protein
VGSLKDGLPLLSFLPFGGANEPADYPQVWRAFEENEQGLSPYTTKQRYGVKDALSAVKENILALLHSQIYPKAGATSAGGKSLVSPGFIRLLSITSGYQEVRRWVLEFVDQWLTSSVLKVSARSLLDSLTYAFIYSFSTNVGDPSNPDDGRVNREDGLNVSLTDLDLWTLFFTTKVRAGNLEAVKTSILAIMEHFQNSKMAKLLLSQACLTILNSLSTKNGANRNPTSVELLGMLLESFPGKVSRSNKSSVWSF